SIELTQATFRDLVLISAIPAFLAVIVLAIGAREIRTSSAKPSLGLKGSFRALSGDFKFFLLVIAVFTLGNSSDAFLVLRAQERGLNVAGVIAMLITFNLIYAAASGPLGAWSDRIGRKKLIIGGWLVYGVIYLGFAAASTGWQIWMVYALYGLYYAAVEGTAKAFVADLIPAEQRGTAYGIYNAVVGLMAFPASLLAGILWQSLGAGAPFLAGAVLALAAGALLMRHRPQPSAA
ncbi:MAG: MFS transporter, partial [Anaerolineae bacterium]|nr:MFS transporter [Anaerolineae bacterium]